MSLGGLDVVLNAPAEECIGDSILRACQRLWVGQTPYFQDAMVAGQAYPLTDSRVWQVGAASKEFFVFKNHAAVAAWADGPTKSNVNTMLHFIIGDLKPEHRSFVEVAVVFDKLTDEIKSFLPELQSALLAVSDAA